MISNIFRLFFFTMVKNVKPTEDDKKQMDEGGDLDQRTLRNRKIEYNNFIQWMKEEKKIENIEEVEDKEVEDSYNEYFFSMRVTPTVNKNKYCCSMKKLINN